MSSDGEDGGDSGSLTNSAGEEESPLATVINGAGWVFGGRVVKLLVGAIVQILIARILGTTSYGGLSLAMTVIGFAGLIAGLGIGHGVSRNVSYYEDEPSKSRGIVRAGLVISVGSHLVAATLLILVAPTIATEIFGNSDLTVLIRIGALGLPFAALENLGTSVASGSRDATTHTAVNQVVGPVANSLLVAALVLFGFGVVGAILGRTVATILMAGLAVVLAVRVFPIDLRGETQSMYRELLGFSLPLMFSGAMTHFIDETDYFVLGMFHSEDLVGVYTAMFTIRPMVLLFFFPATFLLSPVITRLQKDEELDVASRIYQAVSKWTTLVSLPLFLLGFFFPVVVIRATFGAAYVEGVTVLRLLMISGLVTVMFGANDRVMVGLGHSRVSMYVNGLAAGSNILLNFLLIPSFGMIGGAIASVTAFALRNVTNSVLLYQWYGLTPFSPAMVKVCGVVALIAPVGYLGYVRLFPVRLFPVAVLGIFFLIVYVLLVARFGTLETIDAELSREIEDSHDLDIDWVRKVIRWFSA